MSLKKEGPGHQDQAQWSNQTEWFAMSEMVSTNHGYKNNHSIDFFSL